MRPPDRRRRAAMARAVERRRLAAQPSILAAVNLSAAQREQGEVGVLDLHLASVAMLRHPGVRWWWAERELFDRRGAFCYLCDRFITPGTVRAPLTRAAQAAILKHRDRAHSSAAQPMGSQPPTILAGADQHERELDP